MPHSPHIAVFDSGAGGLSVAAEILRRLPQCSLTYSADRAAFPYGKLDDSTLIERVSSIVDTLILRNNPDILVLACNTASTIALETLRERFSLPIVGVVPAVKPAAELSQTGIIGLLATVATVNRGYTLSLVNEFASDKNVIRFGSSNLVNKAEQYLNGSPVDTEIIKQELRQLFEKDSDNKMDTIVLACTHFPIIQEHLNHAIHPRRIRWIDSGEAIARRVEYLLKSLKQGFTSVETKETKISFHCTAKNNIEHKTIEKAYFDYLNGVLSNPPKLTPGKPIAI